MICPNCGEEIDDHANFCPNCGVSLGDEQENNGEEAENPAEEEASVAGTVKQGFIHTTTGKVTAVATAVLLAGVVGISGMAYNAGQNDFLTADEEILETGEETVWDEEFEYAEDGYVEDDEFLEDEEYLEGEDGVWYEDDEYYDDGDVWYGDDEYYDDGDVWYGDDEYYDDRDVWYEDDEAAMTENDEDWEYEENAGNDEEVWEDADDIQETAVDEYILPESDSRYYTVEELSDLDKDTLRIARNEIYARHGRMFDDPELQSYFDSQSWYTGTIKPGNFKESVFNNYEKKNIQLIQALESGTKRLSSSGFGTSEPETSGNSENESASSEVIEDKAAEADHEEETKSETFEFEDSWELIQSYELSTEGYDDRDLEDSKYFCRSLSFTIYGSTAVDRGDYYEVQAVFNKPVLLPQNMGVGDQYTVDTDELKGETTVFYGSLDLDGGFSVFDDESRVGQAYGWYGTFNGEDGMTEITGDDGYRLEEPFYEGVLRIRKDAVTGDLLNLNIPYATLNVDDLDGKYDWQDSYWSNYTAFDENGYVTELVYYGC